MTENEAINYLRQIDPKHIECVELIDMKEVWDNMPQAVSVAEKALQEIQQYRAIGTVEECQEAMEKQKPRNIRISHIGDAERGKAFCPNCGLDIHGKWKLTYCFLCGQKLDWSE